MQNLHQTIKTSYFCQKLWIYFLNYLSEVHLNFIEEWWDTNLPLKEFILVSPAPNYSQESHSAALNDGGYLPAARPGHSGSRENKFRPGLTYRHQEEPANCCAFSHSIFGAGGGGVSLCLWTPPPPHPTPHSSST